MLSYIRRYLRFQIIMFLEENQFLRSTIYIIGDWLVKSLRIHESKTKTFDRDIINNLRFFKFVDEFSFYYVLEIILIFLFKKVRSVKSFIKLGFKRESIHNNSYTHGHNYRINNIRQVLAYGIFSIWNHLRFWLVPVVIVYAFVQYTFFLKSSPFSKILFGCFLLLNVFYLLISGFVFFFKKYQYRLYTSAIQRFWRRTLIIFWLIEVSLFIVFIYLTLNASQEPFHVYDTIQIYKTHFYSWRYFFIKIMTSTFLVVFTYLLLLGLKWNTFSKVNNIVFVITLLLFYIFWLEFYQFFHLMNCYGTADWFYDFEEHVWDIELEFRKSRIANHFVTICFIAKFWHVVFALVFWIFFVLRGLESSRYRYPLLVSNLQNFLIIYIMSWLHMYPWLKYFLRKILDVPYYWFFFNNRKLGFFLFFNDLKLYYWGLSDFLFEFFSKIFFFKGNPFYYWYTLISEALPSQKYFWDYDYDGNDFELKIHQHSNVQFRGHSVREYFISRLKK